MSRFKSTILLFVFHFPICFPFLLFPFFFLQYFYDSNWSLCWLISYIFTLSCYWFLYRLQYIDTSLSHHSLLSDCVKPFHVKCKKLFSSFVLLLSRFTPMYVINTMGCWYYFIFNWQFYLKRLNSGKWLLY